MKVSIELPDVIKDDAGVEYEPTGERRQPEVGEYYLDRYNMVSIEDGEDYGVALILRKKFVWPEWLGGWGIVKDKDGAIYWCERKGCINLFLSGWWIKKCDIQHIQPRMFPTLDFDTLIPDWTKPLLNPNYKAPQE